MKEIPLLGFGTFIGNEHEKIEDLEKRQKIVEESVFNALKAGYRHLDCASEYENLEWVGNALKRAIKPESEGGLGLKREEIWITSKDKLPSAKKLKETLKALGVDNLDLYLLHYPHQDIELIWKEMNGCVDQGLVKNIGVSNFYEGHIEQLLKICDEQELRLPYADEIEISPSLQEVEFHSYCQKKNIRLIAYSPLGYVNSSFVLENEKVKDKAEKLTATAAQIALAWNMARGISVIPSSRNQKHIHSNYQAIQFISELSKDEEWMESFKETDCGLSATSVSEAFKSQSIELLGKIHTPSS